MFFFVLLLLGVITLLFGMIPLWFSVRFKRYVNIKLREPLYSYTPKVSAIIPCKGVDLEFEENISAIFNQNYPEYEVLFVTAVEDDPAHKELKRIMENNKKISAKLLVAGISHYRGQKITNLLKAIENISPETEVFVFLDADIRIHEDFLRYLVAPLRKDAIGATTGFPWYLPQKANFGSILRSLWGGGALPLLINTRHNFASGAANAIKKEVFEKAEIKRAMDRSISDTFAITNSIRKLGLIIEFVPQCLVISPDNSSILDTLKWTNRQTIISRVYSPPFWWTVFLTYSFSNAMLLLGIILTMLWILGEGSFILPGLLMLSLIPLEMINAAYLIPVVKHMIPEYSQEIDKLRWKYYFITPLTSILMMINSLVSLTTNEIIWRGVKYRLVSPTQTEVLSGE
jgi:cellulose synthase/poly-beta-1,6-N-acetylglucosamine synthase-like glycosyltransferase